ncbi:non-hydrolyzing UDP-N-acetylglucosamine 2-epimerase [Rossellomorea yichunensis]|uniref:non-hydrolyzing UDP-N-acetylglucosamine 2-epimerase n=1 Tax=Rossellomorea yichunensis TaxID=3077331 RepID=UPI0028DDF2F0|nr:UDP-N-acetylglucosamine 2-epimerase (non-hydrolyzing) [Rossellomorea sp. YC4-1]MDT9027823.1 UDP-N-acetylglucosamine 2-epimerase (non-hydrolyzing) [Rossellomorea sp. YC4-1]
MNTLRTLVVFGTRPEAIKMAPLIRALEQHESIEVHVCITSQHREMLQQVLNAFHIHPDYDLDIMTENQSLTTLTTRILENMNDIFEQVQPHLVLVHGDTTTTFAVSLAASYRKIPIGHVEAGLRTKNKYTPFPEEINRRLVGVLADLHFAPTKEAAQLLKEEGKSEESIFITGNTAIDALQTTFQTDFDHPILQSISDQKLLLITAHRRENWGDPLIRIFRAIRQLVDKNPDTVAVFPVHLNPNVQKAARRVLNNHPRIHLIEPLDVIQFHNFSARAHLILTDSGGIQEEAATFQTPVLVLRQTTERSEAIQTGIAKLVGSNEKKIVKEGTRLLQSEEYHQSMIRTTNPFGDGHASERIVQAILYHFRLTTIPPESFQWNHSLQPTSNL